MLLTFDHVIVRVADPHTAFEQLAEDLGAPVLAPVEEVSGLASGFATSSAVSASAGGRRSMVVVTEYGFDADAWRAKAGHGPAVYSVEVGTGGHDWTRFPLEPGPLQLQAGGPPGIRRITFEGEAEPFMLGAVAFEFNLAA